MSWAKFDDQYPDHPKIVDVGPLGMALHTAATCYCARYLTDGFIPAAMMSRLLNFDGINVGNNAVTNKQVTEELTRVGLLEIVPGGYQLHDYLEYNPPAAQVKAERAANKKRQDEFRERNKNNGANNGVNNTLQTPSRPRTPINGVPNQVNGKKNLSDLPRERERDPNLDNPAVIAYRNVMKTTPNETQRAEIAGAIINPDTWEIDLAHWIGHGWNQRNVTSIIAFHANGGAVTCSLCKKPNGKPTPALSAYTDASGNVVYR